MEDVGPPVMSRGHGLEVLEGIDRPLDFVAPLVDVLSLSQFSFRIWRARGVLCLMFCDQFDELMLSHSSCATDT